MSITVSSMIRHGGTVKGSDHGEARAPLKIVGPRISMFSVRTERTDVTGRAMDQAMPDHLVLPLESLSTRTAWAVETRTVMRPDLRVHVGM